MLFYTSFFISLFLFLFEFSTIDGCCIGYFRNPRNNICESKLFYLNFKIYQKSFLNEYIIAVVINKFDLFITLYLKFKNVCLDTLDSIVPTNALFRSTEINVRNGVIAALRHVMFLQAVYISQHSQLSQRVSDSELLVE